VSPTEPYAGDTTRSPIVTCTIGSIVSAFLAVGFLAAYLPQQPPLAIPIALLLLSVVLLIAAVAFMRQLRNFAWALFFSVARWVLVLTLTFAVMAEFVFLYDRTPAGPLAIMTVVLILAAVNVPILMAFSVARHERVESSVP
jgi:dolichyl-phosphate-mannose--protein O-mannosyl transferase